MRTRHAIATSLVGLSLTAAGIALPAPASATTSTPCVGLVGCLLTTVTTTTGTLTTAVTGTLNTTVNTTLPTVVNTVLPTKKPSEPGKPGPTKKPHKPHKAHHGQVKHQTVSHSVAKPKTAATVKSVQPTVAQHAAPVITHQPPRTVVQPQNPIVDVIQTVGNAVQTAISLFGWNLLALFPMAGIAFLISRRMGSSRRRSVSGLI